MATPWPILLMARELGAGGSERQLAEVAGVLDRSLFEPHVGCFHAGGLRAQELRERGVPVVAIPARSYLSPSAVPAALALGRYLRRRQIQLVHTFDVPLNLFGVPVARAFRVPVVLASQRAYRSLTSRPGRFFLRLADLLVDGIIANCEAMRRHLIEDQRVSASRIHVCYNGVNTGLFYPGPAERPPALAQASLVIGVVCLLRPEKDLATLLDAFARVRHLQPGLKLLIVGSGPEQDRLRARAEELRLCPDGHFEPATSDVARWLRVIDIFVLPSRSEALSNSLMEAMACGCCPVASRVGGNPELVSDNQTGLLFHPGDPADLAAQLERLITSEPLRRTLAANAARLIREKFTRQASVERMQEIYLRLLTGGETHP